MLQTAKCGRMLASNHNIRNTPMSALQSSTGLSIDFSNEAFALCHFLLARSPVGTPRVAPAAPRQARKGRVGAQISEQRENIRSLRHCAANPGRAGPWPPAASFGGGRSDDRRGPSRSPTGPTSDRPDVPPAGSRAPSPPPSQGRAAGARMPRT